MPTITRSRVFLLAVAALTLLFGPELHRSDQTASVTPSAQGALRPFPSDGLTPANPARCPDGAVRSGHITPRKTVDEKPVHPAEARKQGISGVVIVQVLIDTRGEVAAAKVIRSIPQLDRAAIDAVRRWRYEPVVLNGASVCVGATVAVDVRP